MEIHYPIPAVTKLQELYRKAKYSLIYHLVPHATTYKIDNQLGLTHRELYSIFCDNLRKESEEE